MKKTKYFIFLAIIFFAINTKWEWLSLLSFFASVTSIINVYLISQKKFSNFYWGIASCISYGIYAFIIGYIGDSLLNFLWYLPLTITGMFMWYKHKQEKLVKKRIWKNIYILPISLGLSITFIGWYFLIPFVGKLNGGYPFELNSWRHIFDALTNSFGIIGTILMNFRLSAQYIMYIASNPLNIAMWAYFKDWNMVVVYAIYLIIAIFGWKNWYSVV